MSQFGRSPAETALEAVRALEGLMGGRAAVDALGLIDMDKAALAAFEVAGIPPEWIRTAERVKAFRIRSAAARKGWATRRARA